MTRKTKPVVPVSELRTKLLEAGVKNLKEYGYPACTTENIVTDPVYSAFFVSMLEQTKGQHGPAVVAEIDALMKEIGR